MANENEYGKFVLAQFAISYALIWPSHSRSSLAISQSSNAILIAFANCEDSLKVSSHFREFLCTSRYEKLLWYLKYLQIAIK